MEIIILLLIIGIIYYIFTNKKASKLKAPISMEKTKILSETDSLKEKYKKWKVLKSVFTQEELKFYKELLNYAKNKDIYILSKIRIADLVTPKEHLNNSEFMKVFKRVSQKHVDYVITDYKGKVLCLIELDGKSHSYGTTLKNDIFKNDFFETIKLPLLRFQNYSYHNLSKLNPYIEST